ncbi:TetR/AcrR family transcriptional regulator [Streptomyces sp. NBC_00191]|uniref:TetR/AcrR family transcriptional regulator n=1 Tax=Streptomyces sp. NBC_00191 TaxID=2975674 RepID=UPI0032458DD1
MRNDSDRRVRRTRRALHEALLALMTEKGYDAVTVQDIIDRADVGRSTFYTHFTDKQDLMRSGFVHLRAILEQPHPGSRAPELLFRFSLEMFRHVQGQRQLGRALTGSPSGAPVLREMQHLLADLVRNELKALTPTAPAPDVPTELVVQFVVAAFLATMAWWAEHGSDDDSPERADALFHALVTPGVRAAIALAPNRHQ